MVGECASRPRSAPLARTLTTDRVCAYFSASGVKCLNDASGHSAHCVNHTCPHCSGPKRSTHGICQSCESALGARRPTATPVARKAPAPPPRPSRPSAPPTPPEPAELVCSRSGSEYEYSDCVDALENLRSPPALGDSVFFTNVDGYEEVTDVKDVCGAARHVGIRGCGRSGSEERLPDLPPRTRKNSIG